MPLPPALRRAIDAEAAAVDPTSLRRAAAQLSERYRRGEFRGSMATSAERAAYLLTRLPATFAANELVFREFARRVDAPVHSLLDLGSGPGTALWAATEILPSLQNLMAVERDFNLIDAGRRVAAYADDAPLRAAHWIKADLEDLPQLPAYDVVVLSYALGEVRNSLEVIDRAWGVARVALIVVEPGTPRAFQTVLRARDRLIATGATIAAPCPHREPCPLEERDDWCHFRVRLERTPEHRRLKGAELGYEDEKFSYVIAARPAAQPAQARVIRHPLKHPGHVQVTLCTASGLQTSTIGKSEKVLYRGARKVDWGDAWPPAQE